MWLDKLKTAAYEMEDVLDEWGTEIQRSKLEKLQQHLTNGHEDDGKNMAKKNQVSSSSSSYSCSPISCFKKIALRHDIGIRIREIRKSLDYIKNEKDQFKFNVTLSEVLPEVSFAQSRKETSFIMVDSDIWGRDIDKNIILNKLFSIESSIQLVRKVDNVRTIQCMRHKDHSFGVDHLSYELIHPLRCLRVLKLKNMGITHLSNEIDKLIHLRYLDLSKNIDLDELPESMCNLLNLQVLKLKDCRNLFKLPKGMGRMINMRNFDIRYSGLEYMPKGIGNWKHLHNLSTFIVSTEREGCKMKELRYQNHLNGDLAIKGLGRLNSEEEAAEAELHKKYQLNALRLSFKPSGGTLASSSSGRQVRQQKSETLVVERLMESLLEVLKPHPNLKKLTIYHNLGFRYPGWMGSIEALTNLCYLGLHNCSNCTELPSLGLLPSLEVLVIKYLEGLKAIGVEIYGGIQVDTLTVFPKLIVLEITDMSNLEVVDLGEIVEGKGEIKMMSCLEVLKILRCPELKSLRFPTESLPSLEKLRLHFLKNLSSFPTHLPSLSHLYIRSCPSLISDSGHHHLYLPYAPNLTTLEIQEFHHSPLHLGNLAEYRELRHLNIYANLDDSIKLIPEYVQNLTILQHLEIYSYGKEQEVGDWSILSYIPSVTLNGKKIRSINQ
ncbi:hypothetical protein MKW98_008479 [Papaver atlanticum]|uniref:R13L1/DRL21-like LRR repeat region domain-containing protein n=1 Tax=Papaver atlanticum TaxID=357466 RepID=A0AAD4TN74_9MAGN|nr:hypothetical protein MKW98_008479 [Papaver atlanticum]